MGAEDALKVTTMSANATPTTIPRFLERANKLEASPILSWGKDPMIALLLAGLNNPIPMPRTICLQRISYSPVAVVKKANEKIDKEMKVNPMVAGTFTPIRSESLPPKGAMIITVRATGKINMPTFDGENPKILWRKKGVTKL